tara:strand:+ start:362 stop:742 length:381 start_codon:yes stop_codon:yes gene_type:complete
MWLFLDDERKPGDVTWIADSRYNQFSWDIVRSYDAFVAYIEERGVPEFISFDHDLADEHYRALMSGQDHEEHKLPEKTGYTCAKWLVEYCIDKGQKFPEFHVHSMNPIGGDNIKGVVASARKAAGI